MTWRGTGDGAISDPVEAIEALARELYDLGERVEESDALSRICQDDRPPARIAAIVSLLVAWGHGAVVPDPDGTRWQPGADAVSEDDLGGVGQYVADVLAALGDLALDVIDEVAAAMLGPGEGEG